MASDFNILKQRIDEELTRQDLASQPAGLYDPIRYTLDAGGKRMRSVLVLLASRLFTDDVEPVLPAALAVEVFHNFTLVHDDLMDQAPIRRNQPSVFSKWSPNHAILSGDAMLVQAYSHLAQCDSSHLPHILKTFNKAALAVCEGQQMDMDFESSQEVEVGDYLKMIELKTASLIQLSMELGAVLGGASTEDIGALSWFGNYLGMAFQLQDDILDVYANTEKFGKKQGGDIVAGKKTYLYLIADQLSNNGVQSKLHTAFFSNELTDDQKIDEVTQIYNELKVVSQAEKKMQEYYDKALSCMEKISVNNEKKQDLLLLADRLMVRDR